MPNGATTYPIQQSGYLASSNGLAGDDWRNDYAGHIFGRFGQGYRTVPRGYRNVEGFYGSGRYGEAGAYVPADVDAQMAIMMVSIFPDNFDWAGSDDTNIEIEAQAVKWASFEEMLGQPE